MASCITDVLASFFGEILGKLFRSHLVTEFDLLMDATEDDAIEINFSTGSRRYDVLPSFSGERIMMDSSEDGETDISSSSGSRKYDVFPSFRGEDVRTTFLSHLLMALDRRSIKTFIDHRIERSRSIAPELLSAIRESSISIVVFSKNYASSTWCLNELVEIHKCFTDLGQMVIPVFYGVDPSDVRKQTGVFGKVFEVTCKGQKEDQKQRWVQALADVANMAGEDLQNGPDEAHLVEKIATDVLNKLISPSPSNSFGDFVGIEAHLEAMKSILCLESKEARMVGIWGTSGIGKSTIARALFSQLSGQFPLRNFTTYGKRTNQDVNSMKLIWEQNFLSEILSQKDIKIECSGVVEKRLKDKKVLIFLDNVDNLEFLKTLVGNTEWFGLGSRIIVITQDRQLLKAHDINLLYEVKFPSQDLALQMLCRYSFGENSPPDDFKELAVEVATLAGNLPLGLSVLGSSLRRREKKEWIELLPKLQNGLDRDIMKTLRVSYDRLAETDQKMFHYIAGFFNGFSVEYINEILGDVNIGLKSLAEKSLIRITPDERVEMHNLLEKLGKEIDREESKDNPGKRRFLKDYEEILDVFTDKTGTDIMLGIFLNASQIKEAFISIDENSFEGMLNLQCLQIHDHTWRETTETKLRLRSCLKYLPRKLKWLEWYYCPLKCLPSSFKAEHLVELRMENSELEKLWEGTQPLVNLKAMILCRSKYLKKIPDLSKAINLMRVDLSECTELESFPTPLNSESLEFLDLRACPLLKTFPVLRMRSSSHGTEIEVENCLWNKNLPGFDYLDCFRRCNPSKFRPEHVVELTVKGNMLRKLWEGVQSLGSLVKMDLSECGNLTDIPDLSKATNLEYLILSNCKSLVMFPSTIGNLQKLVMLEMKECTGLEVLPVDINLSSLEFLNLRGCSSLRSFPLISNRIYILYLDGTAIEEVPCCIEILPRLTELSMRGCKMLNKFPQMSSSIITLDLGETAIEQVPCCVENLSNLTELKMHGCKKLKNISRNIFSLTSLKKVDFTDCGGVFTALTDATVVTTKEDHYENIGNINNVEKRRTRDKYEDEDEYGEDGHWYGRKRFKKLDGDGREIILRSCFKWTMVLPGGEVPTYFEHRAYGNSLIVIVPQSSLYQDFLRFYACVVVEPLTDSNACLDVHFHFNGKRCMHRVAGGMPLMWKTDHLVLCSFKFRPTCLPPRLAFYDMELKFSCTKKIKECGIRLLNVSPYPDDNDGSSETEYNQQSRGKSDVVETESIKKQKQITLEKSEEYINLPGGQIVTDTGLTAPNLELPLGRVESSSVSSYSFLGVDSMITKQQDAQIPIVAPEKSWSACSSCASSIEWLVAYQNDILQLQQEGLL